LVTELSDLVPRTSIEKNGGEKCHRAKVLRYAIEYIQSIKQENSQLREQLGLSTVSPDLNNASSPSSSCSSSSDDFDQKDAL
jgi:hypothetical protein